MSDDPTDDLSIGEAEEEELESGTKDNDKCKRPKKSRSLKKVKKAAHGKTEAMCETTDAMGTPSINPKCKLTVITGTSKNGE